MKLVRRTFVALVFALSALLLGFSWAQSSTLLDYHTVVRIPHPNVAYADGQGDSPEMP